VLSIDQLRVDDRLQDSFAISGELETLMGMEVPHIYLMSRAPTGAGVCVCVYACACACVYACVYACVCACVYACVYACVCMDARVCVYA